MSERRERWVVVTPAHNEADRLPLLASSLAEQSTGSILRWIVVDDGSTDGTAVVTEGLEVGAPITVIRRTRKGGLGSGSPFGAFRDGAVRAWEMEPGATRVAKIDADVVLSSGFMDAIEKASTAEVGIVGGLLVNDRERLDHVRGALRAYSRHAWDLVSMQIPPVLGWDVMDEQLIQSAGMGVTVVAKASARVTRRTGSSEGLLRGRFRAGIVSRWTGYHPFYFALRLLRYILRAPYLSGAAAMAWGYLVAGKSPFPEDLRRRLRSEQRVRMRLLWRSPRKFIQHSYGPSESRAD